MDKADARTAAMEKRLDKRMDGITKLLQHGMRMLVRTEADVAELAKAQKDMARTLKELGAAQKELAATQKELASAQKATDRSLKAFIDSLRTGRNGR